jgi:methionine-rich copper-binding protein CopC
VTFCKLSVILRHGVHCLQWRVIASRSALFAVACYCVTERTVCSGVLLGHGAQFAVACYCVTECTVYSGVLLRQGVHCLQWRVIAIFAHFVLE